MFDGFLQTKNIFLFPFIFAVLLLVLEFIHFKLFNTDPNEKYVVKLSENYLDYALILIVVFSTYLESFNVTVDTQFTFDKIGN